MYKWETGIDNKVYEDALQLRKEVFVEEQNVPLEEEIDGKDEKALHVVLYKGNQPVATSRLLSQKDGTYILQRFAVSKKHRRQGLGKRLLTEIINKVQEKNGNYIILHAQDHAIPFYENSGFQVEGEGFLEASIPHHTMGYEI